MARASSIGVRPEPTQPRERPLRLRVHSWLRWLHVYISMFSMLAVLFFALTGVTLNHPEWTFGTGPSDTEVTGRLPAGWRTGNQVDWLVVADHLRRQHGAHGIVADRRVAGAEASISFKAPGYTADAYVDMATGSYQLAATSQGFVGRLNDFHRGRDAGAAWAWVVDLAGVFLALLSATGIGLLLYLRKLRGRGLAVFAVGCVIVVLLMNLAA